MILKISLFLVVGAICYLSLTPSETLTVGNDKISHFIAYTVLMLNIGIILLPSYSKLKKGIVFAFLLGCTIEVLQYFVPGRCMSLGDIVANSIGVGIGCIISILLYRPIQKLLRKARII